MGYIQQFKGLLGEIEDEALRTSLLSAFGNVQIDFDTAITKRDEAKQNLTSYKQTVNNLIGSDNPDDIKAKIDELSSGSSDDIEKVKADLQSKYEADTNELRTMLDDEKSKNASLVEKHESMTFNSELEKQGLLQGFKTDNPRVKEMLLGELKGSLILEDGVFYVKSATGEKDRDIKTGEYLSAKSVPDGMMSSNEWMDFVKPQSKGQGGGTPPSNPDGAGGKKFSDYTSAELVEMNRTNPQQYQALKASRDS